MVNDIPLHNDVGAGIVEKCRTRSSARWPEAIVWGGILVGKEQDDDVPICIIDLESLVAGSVVVPEGSKSHDMEVHAGRIFGRAETSHCSMFCNGYDQKVEVDRNGASVLLWAAGCGHLQIVRFLVETCGCDENQNQLGKRSFAGRTTLHWAARICHLDILQYLVDVVKVNLDASTVDGKTAFCSACWQGHFSILR
eukprot:scaffold30611_cov62-Attheya_sp.AAC.2